ncbi:hypothetical protein [Streptomyces sp. NPDC007264]|uniref:hypothetical protein n=1 Tax=Streptomyces sp. NPDC007264 TaxID=3364777 RepID=UPI0036D975B1
MLKGITTAQSLRQDPGMDLQGIGAVSASAVAALGIPIAVIVGRWQMRGASESARAGVAQAEATYRAALDAVRAETSATYVQWRRSTQREAYVAFLLSAHQLLAAADLLTGQANLTLADESWAARKAELGPLRTALLNTQLIVTLEGSEDLVDLSVPLRDLTFKVARNYERQAEIGRAWTKLTRMCEEENLSMGASAVTPPVAPPATFLRAALGQLGRKVRQHPTDGDYRLLEDVPAEVAQAAEVVSQAFAALPAVTISSEERVRLLDMQYLELPARTSEHDRQTNALKQARKDFIKAAREDLSLPSNDPI